MKNDYYEKQKAMCKALGIKQPPKKMSLWNKFKFIYKQLTIYMAIKDADR